MEDGAPDEIPQTAVAVASEALPDVVVETTSLHMTPEVAKWIEYFTGDGRKHYARWLKRAPLYRPMMQAGLAEWACRRTWCTSR